MKKPRSKSYVINLKPVAWQLPKSRNNKFFDGQTKDKQLFAMHMSNQHGTDPLFSTPIVLEITFYFHRTATINQHDIYCDRGPYIGSFEDWLIDVMKDTVLTDPKMIVSRAARKVWAPQPRIEFTITEV